jgi:hypothetical protein
LLLVHDETPLPSSSNLTLYWAADTDSATFTCQAKAWGKFGYFRFASSKASGFLDVRKRPTNFNDAAAVRFCTFNLYFDSSATPEGSEQS